MQSDKAVLLIEDDADVRSVVDAMLTGLGYAVHTCKDAKEGVTALASGRPYDIIVTDVVMPETSGLELSALVRRWHPQTPVVLMTGKADGVESAVANGFIPLLKPFTRDQLRIVISEALRPRR